MKKNDKPLLWLIDPNSSDEELQAIIDDIRRVANVDLKKKKLSEDRKKVSNTDSDSQDNI